MKNTITKCLGFSIDDVRKCKTIEQRNALAKHLVEYVLHSIDESSTKPFYWWGLDWDGVYRSYIRVNENEYLFYANKEFCTFEEFSPSFVLSLFTVKKDTKESDLEKRLSSYFNECSIILDNVKNAQTSGETVKAMNGKNIRLLDQVNASNEIERFIKPSVPHLFNYLENDEESINKAKQAAAIL